MEENSREQSWRRADWLGVGVFSAAGLSAVLLVMSLGRGLTFFYDEWNFVKAAATSGYWHNVLRPHNGHPSMLPYSVYEVLLHTVGLRTYWPYLLVLVLLDVGCGWLLFVLLRKKVHPILAGAAAAALMLLGPAWQDLLWPFQIGFLGSVAGGLGALAMLDRNTRRADLGACACLVVSIACSGVGLPFLAGAAVELVWRRRGWRRLWIPGFPLALFVVWNEIFSKTSSYNVSPGAAVHSIASATATTVGAVLGRGMAVGDVVSVLLAALIIVALVRSPGRAARLGGAVTGLLTFWILTLLARGASQGSPSRYLYPAAAFVLVIAGELPSLISRGAPAHRTASLAGWAKVVAAVTIVGVAAYAGLAIWWNSSTLTDGADGLAAVSSQVKAELGAVVLAGPALPGGFQPDGIDMPQVTVQPFLKAVTEFGSPGDSRHQIIASSASVRSRVDSMLLRGRPMEVSPGRGPSPAQAHRCERHPIGSGHSLVLKLPPRGVWVTAPQGVGMSLRVRSLADGFPESPLTTLSGGSTNKIAWSAQRTALRWKAELSPATELVPPGSAVTVCPVDPG